jgi:hypothetical protein
MQYWKVHSRGHGEFHHLGHDAMYLDTCFMVVPCLAYYFDPDDGSDLPSKASILFQRKPLQMCLFAHPSYALSLHSPL